MKNTKQKKSFSPSVILSKAKNPFKSILMKFKSVGKMLSKSWIPASLEGQYNSLKTNTSNSISYKLVASSLSKTYGFTLVELIVVITILSILGTISFISFGSYSSSARDSSRIVDLNNISKGLIIQYTTSGKYPIPDDYITLTASGAPIGFQGKVGTNVSSIIKMGGTNGTSSNNNGGTNGQTIVDPLDKTLYTYSTNSSQDKYQLLGFLEDGTNINLSLNNENNILNNPTGVYNELTDGLFNLNSQLSILNSFKANALDYSKRYSMSKGDSIGILLSSGSLEPVENKRDTNTFTGVDLINEGTGKYLTKLSNTEIINDTILSKYSSGLVGYWDMESTTLSGSRIVLKDLSQYQNNGTCYNSGTEVDCGTGGTGPQFVSGNGTSGKGMNFDGVDDWINIKDNQIFHLKKDFTIITLSTINNVKWGAPIISKWSDDEVLNKRSYRLGLNGDGTFDIVYSTGGLGGIFSQLKTPNKIQLYKRYFLASKYNENLSKIYLDGRMVNYISFFDDVYDADFDLRIGTRGRTPAVNNYINGTIDEVRIYNRALSDAEIQALYNATK